MILEGLMTTRNDDGTANVSPMGPIVDADLTTFALRPFQTSTTYRNLKRTGVGVFHVTDDVEMLAHAAIGRLEPTPAMIDTPGVDGFILAGACRWFALRVESLDDHDERTMIVCRATAKGELRPFFGLNRGKHAVVEAAIVVTRLHLILPADLERQFDALRPLVDKTGGDAEKRAFAFLEDHVRTAQAAAGQRTEVRHA